MDLIYTFAASALLISGAAASIAGSLLGNTAFVLLTKKRSRKAIGLAVFGFVLATVGLFNVQLAVKLMLT